MGGDAHRETLALGETINLTARLEGVAEAGGVVISQETLRLVSGLFVTRDLGTPEGRARGAFLSWIFLQVARRSQAWARVRARTAG